MAKGDLIIKTVYWAKRYATGTLVSDNDIVWRVLEHKGDMGCFPGGSGVHGYVVKRVRTSGFFYIDTTDATVLIETEDSFVEDMIDNG